MTFPPPRDEVVYLLGEPEKLIEEQRKDQARLAAEAARLAAERALEAKIAEVEATIIATTGSIQTWVNMPSGERVMCTVILHPDHTWSIRP